MHFSTDMYLVNTVKTGVYMLTSECFLIVTFEDVTHPLKAACGYGGEYNFNEKVQCGETGYGEKFVNLTKVIDHAVAAEYLSFDEIHLSNTANKAIAKAFFGAKHITPRGGFQCTPDY